MYFSIVVPVFNRPDEIDELLNSLTHQTNKNFEVIIAEDGSAKKCDFIVEKYAAQLAVVYFEKPNSGPGQTRNAGAEKAKFDYLIFFDSDCIIPENYIENVTKSLQQRFVDAYGGPDRALPTFTTVQKAINYSMTSFFYYRRNSGRRKIDGQISPPKFQPGSFKKCISSHWRVR